LRSVGPWLQQFGKPQRGYLDIPTYSLAWRPQPIAQLLAIHPAGRQPDRDQFLRRRTRGQAAGSSCASWYPVLVNPANAATTEAALKTCKSLPEPGHCRPRSSTPAPAARSMQPSPFSSASGLTPVSSVADPYSPAGARNRPCCGKVTWRSASARLRSR
jgi:hypothetical protein